MSLYDMNAPKFDDTDFSASLPFRLPIWVTKKPVKPVKSNRKIESY